MDLPSATPSDSSSINMLCVEMELGVSVDFGRCFPFFLYSKYVMDKLKVHWRRVM